MSTQFYNTVFDHSSDAAFRAWGLAFSTALQAAGTASTCLTVTTDTGQINWTTVTRPGTNTAGGYEIYKFTDTNAGASPLYIKLEYGTGSGTTIPQIWATIGTGSNGSGTLTGSTSDRFIMTRQTAILSSIALYPTYFSSNDGSLTVQFKLGSGTASTGMGYLGIGRPCNLDGTLRTDAIIICVGSNNNPVLQIVRVSDGTKFGSVGTGARDFCLIPQALTSSAVAGTFQVYQHVVAYPQIYGINWQGTIIPSEVAVNTSDTATLYGSTAHTYTSGGATLPSFASNVTIGAGIFSLYE